MLRSYRIECNVFQAALGLGFTQLISLCCKLASQHSEGKPDGLALSSQERPLKHAGFASLLLDVLFPGAASTRL